MIPRRLLLVLLALALLAALISAQNDKSSSSVTSGGLRVVTFPTDRGTIKVSLPDDMRAGDTISGTVITEPKGKDPTERKDNGERLMREHIVINDERWRVSDGEIHLTIPKSDKDPEITLTDEQGKQLLKFILALKSLGEAMVKSEHPDFRFPDLAQSGRPYSIAGAFDGNSANTKVQIGDTQAKVIAESPRSAIVEIPNSVVGPNIINVNDNGNSASGSFRGLKIDLTAPKTSLLKGESTELHVEVQGLQGITQPVPVQIQNQTPQNINLTGGNTQNILINPSQVSSSGTYNTSTGITGTGAGGFNITATIPNTLSTTPSPSPVTSKPTATPIPSPVVPPVTSTQTKPAASPASSPAPLPPPTTPEVGPANEEQKFYSSFATAETNCCKRLLSGGVLTLTDEHGNSFTIDHDKLRMTVDGKTYEWQFTMDGKPLWIEWMFCHLNDHQIVSQLSQVMIQRTQGGNSDESGNTTSISMAGPYRDDKTKRPSYGFQFMSQKIGTNIKEFGITFSMDAETCAWSCQLIADGKALEFRTNPARSTNAIFNGLNQSVGIPSGATAYKQQAWWNAMYSYLNEIADWYLWLDGHESDDLRDTNQNYNMWRAKLQLALVQMLNSAGPDDKSLINQMLGLLDNEHPSPEQIKQIWLKFDDLHLRYGTKVPNDVRKQIMSTP